MAPITIVLIEDEDNLLQAVRYSLEQNNYLVKTASTGEDGLELISKTQPALIVLDVMLPGISGYDVCKEIRKSSNVPIIMLTARGEEVDKVVGLELGADDYVTKPFSTRELIARIRALIRRSDLLVGKASARLLQAGNISIDPLSHIAEKNGSTLKLSPREFDLLSLFVQNPGRAYTREILLESLWGHNYIGDDRTVDVHVRWLREKIEENPGNPVRLVTVRGVGYRFEG
jgi:two-component system alkaline phosphatase synthesis response regulator PhoP